MGADSPRGRLQVVHNERGELGPEMRRDARLKPGPFAGVVAFDDLGDGMNARDGRGFVMGDLEFDKIAHRPQQVTERLEQTR